VKLCSFVPGSGGEPRVGVFAGGKVLELSWQGSMLDLVSAEGSASLDLSGVEHRADGVAFRAPVETPGKIVAAIVNTRAMLGGEEVSLDRPRLDMKAPSTVVGPGDTIRAPKSGVRPEVELAAIVGRRVSRASVEASEEAVYGFTVLNDVTAPKDSKDDAYEAYRRDKATGEIRKMMMRGPLFRSKNHDTFCPMGPFLVTKDEVDLRGGLRMTTKFEGSLVQTGSTSEYIFKPAEIVSYVSNFLTLEPGDVVSCGSVGWSKEALGGLDPTEYVLPMRDGTLELEIEGVGTLRNPVAYE